MTVPTEVRYEAVLGGLPLSVNSDSLGAEIAASLLADLGAEITAVQSGPADIAELGTEVTPTGIEVSPYGPVGEFRDGPRTEQAVLGVGGALHAQWSYRPGAVYQLTSSASAAQGILIAIAALARRLCADPETSDVRPHVSALHGLFALQMGGYGAVVGKENDRTRWRHTPRGQQPTYATYQCSDGNYIFIGASVRQFMVRVLETLGLADEIPPPPEPGQPRQAFQDVEVGTGIWKQIADAIATQPREHWLRVFGEEVNVPIGPVNTVEEAVAHDHVKTLGLIDDGLNLRNLVRVERTTDTPPPAPVDRKAPLEGLKVLEVTGYIAGSYVGRLLADLGADVVKIEAPTGDPFRRGDGNGPSLGFVSWNYGKRGMALDLSSEEGKAKVMAMAGKADIFVTNYRANSLRKLGLSREELFAVNPNLIHCVISAFGEGGPLSHLQGFDPIVQAFSGVQMRQGGNVEPVKSQMAQTDYMSAMLGTLGVIAARTRQLQDGGGYAVSSSLLNGALLLVYDAIGELREGREYSKGAVDYDGPDLLEGVHETADGWLLATAEDRNNAPARAYLEGGLKEVTTADAITKLNSLDVAAVPCTHPDDVRDLDHCRENGYFFELAQPEHGHVILPAPVLRRQALTLHSPIFGEEPSLEDWGV